MLFRGLPTVPTHAAIALAVFAAGLFNAPSAHAAPIVWTLSNVEFDDGRSVTGSFAFDADTTTYSLITLNVSGLLVGTFDAIAPSATDSLAYFLRSGDGPDFTNDFVVRFSLANAMTNAGGLINLNLPGSGMGLSTVADGSADSPFSFGISGSISAAEIPEPSTLLLVALGLMSLRVAKRTSLR